MQVDPPGQSFPSYDAWRTFLARSALALAALLLGGGAVCLVAANWPGMDKWQRFGLAQGVLALLAGAAVWREGVAGRAGVRGNTAAAVGRAALLGLAGIVLGALLALVGQTYQTGADTWQLFAWWALLLLSWAVAAGSAALWLLWVLVLQAAAWFWLHEVAALDWLPGAGRPLAGVALALLDAALLAAWERLAARHGHRGRSGPRLLAALMLAALVPAVVLGDLDQRGAPVVAASLAATAGLAWAYRRRTADLVILAMAAAGGIAVSLRLAGEFFFSVLGDEAAMLLTAIVLLAESAWAARWLKSRAGRSTGAGSAPGQDRHADPWYVQLLLALGAWLATLLLLVFLAAIGVADSPAGALTAGVAFVAAAALPLRAAHGAFLGQVAVAAGLAGLALAGYGMAELLPPGASAWIAWLALSAVLYALAPQPALRLLCGAAMALAVTGLLHSMPGAEAWQALTRLFDDRQSWRLPWAVAVLAGAAALLFAASGRAVRLGHPLAWSWAASAQALAWLVQGTTLRQWPALWAGQPASAAALAILAALPAALAAWALASRRSPAQPGVLRLGLPAALLALALFWLPSPGVALALGWVLLGQATARPRLAAFGAFSLLLYLLRYYYQQDVPLLDKGVWLCGAGLVLLGLYASALRRRPAWRPGAAPDSTAPGRAGAGQAGAGPGPVDAHARPDAVDAGRDTSPAAPGIGPRRRRAFIAGGLLLALGSVNAVIAGRERLLAQGRQVVLELAPVDPRALMQGDYMALDFALARDLERDDKAPPRGYVIVRPDAAGVARMVRVQQGPSPLAPGELALRYRRRGAGVHVATNAYFFPEGQAGRYAHARYGVLRVDNAGNALLTGLLDQARQPL